MQDYSEKRNYPRMEIDCPASFHVVGGSGGGAIVKNLSGGGILMWIDEDIPADTVLKIEIRPVNEITPPMLAEVRVVRCEPVGEGAADGSFAIACQMQRILG